MMSKRVKEALPSGLLINWRWLGLLLPFREKAGDEGRPWNKPRLVQYFIVNMKLDPHPNPLPGREREPRQDLLEDDYDPDRRETNPR